MTAVMPDATTPPYPATVVDRLLMCSHEALTSDLQCALIFDGRLDHQRLGRAVENLYRADPLIGCRLVMDGRRSRWEACALEAADLCPAAESDDPQGAALRFMAQLSDPSSAPQLQVRLFRGSHDVLVLKLTHIAGDGASLIESAYRLATAYRKSGGESDDGLPVCRPPVRDGRSLVAQLNFDRRSFLQRYLKRPKRVSLFPGPWQFPRPVADGSAPTYVLHAFDADRLRSIAEYARSRRATVNLVLLAAFYRALAAVVPRDPERPVIIPTTISLRGSLRDPQDLPACNLSSVLRMTMEGGVDVPFEETLEHLRLALKTQKREYSGLGSLPLLIDSNPLLASVLGRLPDSFFRKQIERRLRSRRESGNLGVAGFTNTGRMDAGRLDFGTPAVRDVIPTWGIPTLPGLFPLVAGGFGDRATLSVGVDRSLLDAEMVANVLQRIDDEIPA